MSPFTVARMTIREFEEESPLLFGMQGNSIPNTLGQCVLITEQEEQQVQHDEQICDEFERTLAITKGLCSDVLASRHKAGGNFFLHRAEARDAETIQQIGCPCRQDVMDC